MRRTPDRDLIAQARDIAERAHHLSCQLSRNLQKCDEWSAGGTPSSGGEHTRGGDVSTPTERRAVPHHKRCSLPHNHTRACVPDVWKEDPYVRVRRLLEINLKAIDGALSAYEATARGLSVMTEEEAKRVVEQETVPDTFCANPHCAKGITGLGDDRPRGGRCNSCREYKRVNGTERPHELVHRQPEPDCGRCKEKAA